MSEQSEAPRDRPHNSYPYDTGLVRELLKRKRKVRGIKSCFPCRHRKVKCDGESPCESCVRRGHEELCRFPGEGGDLPVEIESAPAKRIAKGHTSNEDLINRLTAIESQISSLKADLLKSTVSSPSAQAATEPEETSRTRRSGSHYVEDATGATIYLGSHSDSPLVLGCRRQASLPLSSASPDMMLHNVMMDQVVPRAYPFTSLWGPDVDIAEVCKTLPGDEDVIRYWQIYQSTTHPFYPALVTIDQFNMSLFDFLDRRAEGQNDAHPSWLALLFAVLACGVQFSDDAVQERDLRSKVFVCSSFQCLRMSNFFNQADLDEVQTMALIGNYSRNNLDTNSSWILMGTTMRLAQSIGLHEAEDPVQKQLWWTLIWQDTSLSFSYDRPTNSTPKVTIPCIASNNEGCSFAESVFTICQIILDRRDNPNTTTTQVYKEKMESVLINASPFLQDKKYCTSLQNHLERLALGINLGYAICKIGLPSEMSETVDESIIQHAKNALQCFIDLHRYSARVCRSWAFVHNTVSCAIALMNLNISTATDLVNRLIGVLEKEQKESEWCDGDMNKRHFGPYSRALNALRCVHDRNQ